MDANGCPFLYVYKHLCWAPMPMDAQTVRVQASLLGADAHGCPKLSPPTPPPAECMNNQGGMIGPEVSSHQFHEKMEEFFIPPEQQQQPPSFETALQNHQTYPSPTWSSESLDFNMTSAMEL